MRRPKIHSPLHLVALLLAGLILAGAGVSSHALADGVFKNLKVLPKGVSKDELKRVMKAQSRALGVQCEHCHDADDMAKETKKKAIGRDMMRMTQELNRKWFKAAKPQVSCATCHQGHEKPPELP